MIDKLERVLERISAAPAKRPDLLNIAVWIIGLAGVCLLSGAFATWPF